MVRVYVVIWIVAWTFLATAAVNRNGAKVTKCCPRDTILKINMNSCTGYIANDHNQHESFDWSPTDKISAVNISSSTSNDDLVLSVSNKKSIPWWIPDYLEFGSSLDMSDTFKPDYEFFDANGRMPCNSNDREATLIDDDVAVLQDGRLIMFRQKIESADDHKPLIFSSSEYCIDRVSLLDNYTVPNGSSKKRDKRYATAARNGTVGTANTTGSPTYTYVALVCRPCSRITCVPKCCAKGFMLEYQKNAIAGCRKAQYVTNAKNAIHLMAANGTKLKRKDYYFYGMKPPDCGARSWYIVNKTSNNGPNTIGYGLLSDGRMQVDGGMTPIDQDEYCVDAMNVVPADGSAQTGSPPAYTEVLLACRLGGINTIVVAGDDPLEFREILYGVYFVVGTAFLAATLLIYAVLPELRVTVHSGNLIAHTVCLFVSYATLAATTLVRNTFNNSACIVAGFVIQFSFLAAFFWINVMCADIAWTFSGFRLLLYSNKIENEKKKYIIYSIYAWGCSIAITILTALAEFTDLLFGDSNYKPNFSSKDCWFSNKKSVGVFFYLPIGILLITNSILFLFTAFRIVFIRRDTSKILNRQSNQNKMRLSLYLKLFCLMGVTFVFEVISWAVDAPPYYWYVTDAVNSLRGVFVFFIFCWKRSVLNLLLARAPESIRERFVRAFGIRQPRRYPSFSTACQHQFNSGTSTTTSTRTHSLQMSTQNAGGSSFQLSRFNSTTSMAAVIRKDTIPRQ